MFDELYPAERATSLAQSVQRPPEPPRPPDTFQGFGGALLDALPYAANTSASAWAAILDAYGKAAAYQDAPTVAMLHGRPAPDLDKLRHETIDQMGDSPAARAFRDQARKFAPDPVEVGMAGQITHGVLSNLVKAGVYLFAGPAGPVLYGADQGINRAQELSDQGVDARTAAGAGIVTGAAGAVGMRLPAALGATRLQSAAIGAAVNPALNVAEIGSIRLMLELADYDRIAAQYDPLDSVNLTVAALTGGAFGAAFHRAKPSTPRLTPDEHAAALTMHDARTQEANTLTRPGDIPAANAAHDALAAARRQLDAGEAVTVAHGVDLDAQHVGAAVKRAVDSLAGQRIEDAVQDVSTPVLAEVQTVTHIPSVPEAGPSTLPGVAEAVREVVSRLFHQRQAPEASPGATTPEQVHAHEIAARRPDLAIPTGEVDASGAPVTRRVADLLIEVRDIEANAKTETAAFRAAVNCVLRFPP